MHPNALLEATTDLLRLVLRFEHPADAVVDRFFRDQRKSQAFGPRERSTLTETVFNVLRQRLLFEHFAPSGTGAKERRLALLGFAAPRDFLKTGLSEVEKRWLDQCDAIDPNGLLDRHRHNLPDWLAERLKAQLGTEDFWQLVEALHQPAPLDLRVNTLVAKRADVRKDMNAAAIRSEPTPFSPWGLRVEGKPSLAKLEAFQRGAIEVQDEGSQLLALLLDAKRGEMVVDFCAGAGGKTLAIGATMRNTGRLYAFDTSAHRLAALKPRLARSGLSNVHPVAIAHERDDRIKRLAGKIDRVLVDAPCSGLGTLRRNPDLKWRLKTARIDELAAMQTAILQSAARLVKPGGRLVYATCSLLVEENEAIAAQFSEAHAQDFALLPAAPLLDALGVEAGAALCAGPAGNDFLRLWPHRHRTDGFFAAVWQRT
ncbi:MAG: RsmB/NOP family class I SAM-dependent RNA methyltransferase [Burkholderiales bacterium]